VSVEGLPERLASVQERIALACQKSSRDPGDVRLIAVTKLQPPERVLEAAQLGLTEFGENRVQEGVRKIEAVSPQYPRLRWHLIGQLQTNKARSAVKYFEEIQSVDREALVAALAAEAARIERTVPIFVEVNVAGEESKAGITGDRAEALLRSALAAEALEVRGLMAVPPFFDDPEQVRPYFRALRDLRDRLRASTGAPLPELSMGMSHDFEAAIEEGATCVRIGTALFGERPRP
jgi:pyridoxal phosphate enzyme (YggS family)